MKKKIYIKVHPNKQENLDRMLDESMRSIRAKVPNVKAVEGQVGLTGDNKKG